MANILCKIPTRSRPDAFDRTFQSFAQNQSNDNKIEYLISIDDDDQVMLDFVAHEKEMLNHFGAKVVIGPRSGKIGSVNRDIDQASSDWEIIMQPADDFICLVDSWDKRVVEELSAFDGYDGVVWFFDGYMRDIDTLSIMGRKYYERFGYIYHPDYKSFWADVEFTEVADMLDRLVFCEEVLFRHDHPDWTHSRGYSGKREGYDQLYVENDSMEYHEHDHKTYCERKARGFDLNVDSRERTS